MIVSFYIAGSVELESINFCRPMIVRGDITLDFSVRPVVQTSGRLSPFSLKFFCLLISQWVFIGLLLFFYIQLPKKIFCYCKFRRLRLNLRFLVKVFEYGYISVTINNIAFIFYIPLPKDLSNTFQNFGVWDFWLKFLNMVISQ